MELSSKAVLDIIAQAVADKKGRSPIAIDISSVSSEADYVFVAEGNVDRHLSAMATNISDALKEVGDAPTCSEGKAESGWVVLDCFSVMVHLFLPDQRDKYRIENLWREGNVVNMSKSLNKDIQEDLV